MSASSERPCSAALSSDGVPSTCTKNEWRIYGGEPIPTTNPATTKVVRVV